MNIPFHGNLYPQCFRSFESEAFTLELVSFPVGAEMGGFWKAVVYRRKTASGAVSQLSPSKALFIVHGFGEHAGRYAHFPSYLSNVDLFVMLDLYGHGLSPGIRGDAPHFEGLTSGLVQAFKKAVTDDPKYEWSLFGHSMGGAVVLDASQSGALSYVTRFIVSAPFLALKSPINPIKRSGAWLLNRLVPELSLSADVDSDILFSDEVVKEAFLHDQLRHTRMTPRYYVSLVKAQARILSHPDKLPHKPWLVLLPSEDRLVDGEVTKAFFEKTNALKQLIPLHGARHEAFNDLGRDEAFQSLNTFLGG